MKTNIHFYPYLAHFFLEWEMFRAKVVEEIKTHILCSLIFFFGNLLVCDNVEKHCSAGQAADNNIAHAHCMRDN